MAFRLKNGDMFLHVPRCGGTFVTAVLRELDLIDEAVGLKHDCPGVVPMDMTVRHFVFIRHPYELLRSTYAWLVSNTWGPWPKDEPGRWWHPWSEITKHCGDNKDTFAAWLRWIIGWRTGYVTRLYSKFANWPCTKFVGRTEWLEDDLVVMLGMLGVSEPDAREAMEKKKKTSKNGAPVTIEPVDEALQHALVVTEAGACAMWEGRVVGCPHER